MREGEDKAGDGGAACGTTVGGTVRWRKGRSERRIRREGEEKEEGKKEKRER